MNTVKQLRHIERDLNGIIAAISQVSNTRARRARRVTQIAAGKLAGAATVGGALMFISTFGSASTGTAIGALSGAAATSAQMFWIGSIFGLGAVAGATILTAAGAVLGILAAWIVSRALFGRPRKPERMQPFETRALYAGLRLAEPLPALLAQEARAPSKDELRVYAHEGLLPLCALIEDHLTAPTVPEETPPRCSSFAETLAPFPRWKLKRHYRHLFRRARKLARPARVRGSRRWSSRSPSSA